MNEPVSATGVDQSNYSALNPAKVLATIQCLERRISERFPESGLSAVCRELEGVCASSTERIESISRPNWPLRILWYFLIGSIFVGLIVGIVSVEAEDFGGLKFIDWVHAIEAAINDVILISAAVFFVWTMESRLKRRKALRSLHELRSIAHVIDMHQLTKDPERLFSQHLNTASSPRTTLTPFLMRRYLDYCAEMLALTGKVAALYLRTLDEPTVVATVNEIEGLTTGLGRKIWQKIELIRPDVESPQQSPQLDSSPDKGS